MPSVEELLSVAEADANTRSAMDSRIEIDADTRIIRMTPQDELFGVESDEKSERKYFKVPKIVGNGVDLSKLQLRINYQNASKIPSGKDMYIVQDATVYNDEWVYFSWELSRKVTQYKGNIYFIVCAVKADSNGNITNEWNTTLAEGKVLEGLEVETSQEQQYQASDYLEQLKQQLLDYSKEIKDTFPSDYTQIQDDIGSLKGDIVNLDENLFTNFESSSILDFDLGEINSFIPYRRSRNAGIIYITNGNLLPPKITWINNNGSQFDGVNGASDTNRVRTSTFSIPSECDYLTLSGYNNTVKLLTVRAFDRDEKPIKRGCIITPKDGYYILKVSTNTQNIHLLFGTVDEQVISPSTISSMPLMLNIGISPREYVEPKRKEVGFSIYNYGNEVNVSPSYGLYTHNTIWTHGNGIQFLYKKKNRKNNYVDNIENRYKTSKFNKKCVIPQYYNFSEYQYLSNVVTKFDANTTADEYITAMDTLYRANTDYIIRRHFGETDASGTYDLYAYELNNPNFSASNKPKILLACNQHGYEKNAAFSAYWLMDALCNHYQENELLTVLRNEVSFLIAPLVNPWGFNEYVGDKVGTGTGYENANGVNINRDYENLTSPESQFVMNATDRFSNAILSIDLHSNGTTRTSNDYEQLNWHSYENNSALFLVDVSDEFLNLASQAISKELNIDDTSMGLINIGEKSSNGHTLTYAWSNLSMTNLCFEVPMRLPAESEEDTVLCQKIGTELLVNFIGMTLQKYKEFN